MEKKKKVSDLNVKSPAAETGFEHELPFKIVATVSTFSHQS